MPSEAKSLLELSNGFVGMVFYNLHGVCWLQDDFREMTKADFVLENIPGHITLKSFLKNIPNHITLKSVSHKLFL